MKSRAKIFLIIIIVVIVSFACSTGGKKVTPTPTIDTAATQAAQVAAEKATAKAQAAVNDKATADAKAAADAKATTDAKAAADAKATVDAKAAEVKATADAKATQDAQAALDAKATADAQATLDAKAALDAKATADAQAAKDTAATATQEAKQAAQTAVAAQATQAAQAILSTVQGDLTTVGLSTDTGQLGWLQTGSETIDLETAGTYKYTPFATDLVASDFVIKSEVTWKATVGLVICGVYFRAEPSYNLGTHYELLWLRYSGLPAWDIEAWKGETWFSTVTGGRPRFASAIKMDNGATNKFIMIAEGNKFTVYINDERIGTFYDDSKVRADGRFAFYGSEESGVSSCKFENTWVWLLK